MEDSFADLNTPFFTQSNRLNSNGGKSFKSVQTSFTQKGHGWECKDCSMLNYEVSSNECELCGGVRHISLDDNDDNNTKKKKKSLPRKSSIEGGKDNNSNNEEAIKMRKSGSTYTGTSKSTQSKNSRSTAIDPPSMTEERSNSNARDAPSDGNDNSKQRRGSNNNNNNKGMKKNTNTHRRASMNNDPNNNNKPIRSASTNQPHDKHPKHHENNNVAAHKSNQKKGKKKGGAIITTGAQVIQSLSNTPLPGEDTPKAIAQLLGLTTTEEDYDNGDGGGGTTNIIVANYDGDTTVNNDTKYSGSKGSTNSRNSSTHNRNRSSVKSGSERMTNSKQRRATFSQDIISNNGETTKTSLSSSNNNNGVKLNKKIMGDREKVEKNKAVKRGEVVGEQQQLKHEFEGENAGDYELSAAAKVFVPVGLEDKTSEDPNRHHHQQQQNVRGKKKKNGKNNVGVGENQHSFHNDKQDQSNKAVNTTTTTTDGEQIIPKQSKKNKGQQQQQLKLHRSEPTGTANLTLQAMKQSKQQQQKKAHPNKETKEKSNEKDTSRNSKQSDKNNGHSTENKTNINKDKKKPNVKQQQNKEPNNNAKSLKKKVDEDLVNEKKTNSKIKAAATANLSPAIPPNQPQTTNDLNYAAGRPIVVVHIAEKPSIAQAIAQGLNGGGACKSVGKSLPTHEFNSPPFPKAPKASKVTHRVSSVVGHVFNVDFPKEYQSWDTVDPAELFHAPLVKKPCKGSVVKHLQELTKGSDFIVLWMDCDREGENINFEVLDCCSGNYDYDRVYRAHFSAINPSDIIKAYNKLGKPDRNQSLSVDARQELDLKVGVAFSRFQTRYFQGRYGDLDSAVLSYGPCQTPTLGFCVQRHLDIETFKPEPYWTLDLGVMNKGSMCRATWDSGRSFNQHKVEEMLAKCRNASPAATVKVTSLVSKEKKQGRPLPLNTVALLKACSKALGIGPHQALSIAERLYLSGYLSYPRTESTRYPASFDIKGTLQSQTCDSRWGSYVSDLLKKGANVGKSGVDMGDHPPITPCRHARAGELSGDSARVYDLVARHFIASVSEDAVWNSTTICLSIEELAEKGMFTIRGKQMVKPGFLAIVLYKQYGDEPDEGTEEDEEEKVLPDFQVGDQFGLNFPAHAKSGKVSTITSSGGKHATLDIKERMTTPPTYLTESELISKMEHNGIGTDASISTHIENILKRNYVELISGRKLKPSRLGLVLAQGYHLIDDSLVLPRIRSDIEDQCVQIAKGLADRDAVVKKAIEIFSSKFRNFCENINKMDVLFSSSFAQLQDVGKPFTRCGLTRRYLQFINGPPPRLYNKTTETVYPLPIGGEIKQWTGRNCPVDGCNFELCLYSVGAPPRTFPLCPNCFNNPKAEWGPIPGDNTAVDTEDADDEKKERQMRTMAGKNMIRECPHPDNHPLIAEMTVSPDPESDGVLILDPHLGPKWRLVSTREPTIVHLPKSVEKVTILDKKDEIIGCHMMSIEFKDGESPIDGKSKYTSSFANDEILQGLVRVHHGDDKLKLSSHGRGGRGGRGRGGRGRGRGRGHR